MSESRMLAQLYKENVELKAKLESMESLVQDLMKNNTMLEQKLSSLSELSEETKPKEPTDDIGIGKLLIIANRKGVKNIEGGLGVEDLTKD